MEASPSLWTWLAAHSGLPAELLPAFALGLAGLVVCAIALGIWRRRALRRDFQALAADALARNSEGFLALASERFRALSDASAADWGGRQRAIEDVLAPLRETLERTQRDARDE